MSSTPNATTTARETAKKTPLENAKTLRDIYTDTDCEFPVWVLQEDRWTETDEKSHNFDDTIVVYDNENELPQVKELVEQREPVNVAMSRYYDRINLEKHFGWKTGAYGKSTKLKLYPNIGIYCHARVTNGVSAGAEEKNVHVMNLIGYAFDSALQPDYIYFKYTYGEKKTDLTFLDTTNEAEFKLDLIKRYRKIWLKACYICKFKNLKNIWYYGVGNGNFSKLLPTSLAGIENFYNKIFAEAFGIDPQNSDNTHGDNDKNDLTIPINFCKAYGIKVLNLQKEESQDDTKQIPAVLFNPAISIPENTLYINAWDPWSIIGNENKKFPSLDSYWGRNSNMSVLGWSMTNSKLLPDIVGGDSGRKSKILSMKEILDNIPAAGSSDASSPVSSDTPTPPPSTPSAPSCSIDKSGQNITDISVKCQTDIFKLAKSLDTTPVIAEEPKEMSNLVSAIGTDYSSSYATEKIMPAGSATLLYIGDTELYNVTPPNTTTKTSIKIKYMIQASPAKAGEVGRDITKDTISNSIVNSLILAAKNGVETIFFPFIGGELFYTALKEKVDKENNGVSGYTPYDTDKHAEVLVKGVTDFYTNFSSYGITSNPIKEIFFVTYNAPEERKDPKDKTRVTKAAGPLENEAIRQAYDKAKLKYPDLTDVLKPSIRGNVISNAIYYSDPTRNKPNIAIVNAANTQLEFGAGVSNMCYAGLTGNLSATDKSTSKYQIKLNNIKTKFIEAFNVYIANPTAASPPPPSKPPATQPATPITTKVPFDDVLTGLVDQITDDQDPDTNISTLGMKDDNFIYKDGSKVENINSAAPTIDVMITAFENADGGDRVFYLGACRSIQAAYKLEFDAITGGDASANEAKMRAKLLLNLRKNSLLLKVPARWDYATMKLGVEVEPALTPDEVKAKYDILQQECATLTKDSGIYGSYDTEQAYKLAEQLIPLDEKMEIGVLEEKNRLLHEIYPTANHKYEPVEIKQLPIVNKDGKNEFKRIQIQADLNCGRAALLNFFGTEDLLDKGEPLQTDVIFDLKLPRPSTKIDMGAICNLNSKCMKLFSNSYNETDDGCPDNENYSDGVLGITLQILGYNTGDTMVFGKNPEKFPSYNNSKEDAKLQDAPNNKNILGYLVNLDKAHWVCFKRSNLTNITDSFYKIDSTAVVDETNPKTIKELVDNEVNQPFGKRGYALFYAIVKSDNNTNIEVCKRLTKADNIDFYKNRIDSNNNSYKWKLFMKEVTSNIQTNDAFKTDEEKLKVMFYLSNFPTDIISDDLKEQILTSNESVKARITQIFVDDTKENINKIKIKTDSGSELNNELEIINQSKSYLTLISNSDGVNNFIPTFDAKDRFYYNLNNTNTYKKGIDTSKTNYRKLIEDLKTKVKTALSSASYSFSIGGGFKPRHNPITNNTGSKSKHNSSFKVSSSSKAKVKSRSHTQRVK